MTPTAFLLALMLLAPWFVVLSSWQLRNWRATAVGLAATAAILGAGLLPDAVSPWIRGGLWAAALLVFLLQSDRFVAIAPEESRFVESYVEKLQRIRKLYERVLDTDSAIFLAEFEGAVTSLEILVPPETWAELHADTVRELRRRQVMMTLLVTPSIEMQRENAARSREIERRFRERLKERAGFWTGWPLNHAAK